VILFLHLPSSSPNHRHPLTFFTTAENHPANDYPDEEASSDDDEFDFDDSASEDGGTGYMSRYRGHVDSDEDY
jgi:hypothetical protein